ncbi:transposase [Sinorhizobium medicae]|uniref:transposase n=1 Tax=Sinorhizobium medicae TaxID=110321 RepID=UPI0035CFDC88
MAPLRGWAPRGERLVGYAPFGHWNTMTFVAALRADRASALPLSSMARSMANASASMSSKFWCRNSKPATSSSWTISAPIRVRRSAPPIRKAGARLFFLPKYSPNLNPIEKLFAKIKHWLREAQARSRDAIHDELRHILQAVTPQECAAYFKEAGYERA